MHIAYFVIGVLLLIGEVLLPSFILLPFGIGSIAAGISFWIIASHGLALAVFAVCALATVFIVKRSHRIKSKHHPVIGLVGQIGIIEVSGNGVPRVRVFGDLWEIYREPHATSPIPSAGAQVKIEKVIGNKVSILNI